VDLGWEATAGRELVEISPGVFQVKRGELVHLSISNRSDRSLYMVLLDLQPDGGITQVYPSVEGGAHAVLEPFEERCLPLVPDLPPGLSRGRDVLQVMATHRPLGWRWLELPGWEGVEKRKAVGEPGLGGVAEETGSGAAGDLLPGSEHDWTSAKVEVEVVDGLP
jgi:hypothetical protein